MIQRHVDTPQATHVLLWSSAAMQNDQIGPSSHIGLFLVFLLSANAPSLSTKHATNPSAWTHSHASVANENAQAQGTNVVKQLQASCAGFAGKDDILGVNGSCILDSHSHPATSAQALLASHSSPAQLLCLHGILPGLHCLILSVFLATLWEVDSWRGWFVLALQQLVRLALCIHPGSCQNLVASVISIVQPAQRRRKILFRYKQSE